MTDRFAAWTARVLNGNAALVRMAVIGVGVVILLEATRWLPLPVSLTARIRAVMFWAGWCCFVGLLVVSLLESLGPAVLAR